MRRIIVVGGFGFFGQAICQQLKQRNLQPLVGSRRSTADCVVDVENEQSLREFLRTGDLVIDAAGPFQTRTTLLVKAAVKIGFDLIDLADCLAYVDRVSQLRPQIERAGIRVLTACSVVSSVSAAAVRLSGVAAPVRVTGVLVPAARYSAVDGTAASLFHSVGAPIQIYEDQSLVQRIGWQTWRTFKLPAPLGNRTGHLFECADSVTLPQIWPCLESVEFYVDTNVRGLNTLLWIASHSGLLRRTMSRYRQTGLKISRLLGRTESGVGYNIQGDDGQEVDVVFAAMHRGYLTAVAPAVLAAECICHEGMNQIGLITPEQHVDPQRLVEYLAGEGIRCSIVRGEDGHAQSID